MAAAPTAPDITDYLYPGDQFQGFDSMTLAWGMVAAWWQAGVPDQGNNAAAIDYTAGGLG